MFLEKLMVIGIPAVLAVTVHEVAHGWVANKLGDSTAAQLGRLSLNPLRHVDPIGTVVVPLTLHLLNAGFLFGWAKPVPVNWRNLRHVRRDMALVAVAGPFSNLLMLLGWLLALMVFGEHRLVAPMSWTGIFFNATIMLLNLLPIPPLDGSRIVTSLLPARAAVGYSKMEPFGIVILLVLMATGVVGAILIPGLHGIEQLARALLR